MKKLLLKIVLCATAILAAAGFIAPITVSAETSENNAISIETENVSSELETSENSAEIVEETESAKWFDETLKPLIIKFGAEVAAFAFVVVIALKDLNKTKSMLGGALGALTQSNTDNKDTAKAVEELKAEYAKQKAETQKQMEDMAEMFGNALRELKECLGDKVTDIDETAHKLLEVEKLAYGSNATLVNNGTAKRIAEIVGYGKAKDENNN